MKLKHRQRTLVSAIECRGKGLHSGKKVTLNIKPAEINHGIKFKRVDLPSEPVISAIFNMVVDTSLATVIGCDGAIVSTIEHLMAAFSGLSIDNALVEIDDYEVPVMDGSASAFTEKILEKGIKVQDGARHYFKLKEPIELRDGDKFVAIYPDSLFKISCFIDFKHPLIGIQSFSIEVSEQEFADKIAKARTFGFVKDLEYMKRYGLAKGGSLDNAVVVDEASVINKEGLRYEDEFVRHKLLDSIGDFSLLGMPVLGHLKLVKSGHQFNHKFLEKFFKMKDSWETGPI